MAKCSQNHLFQARGSRCPACFYKIPAFGNIDREAYLATSEEEVEHHLYRGYCRCPKCRNDLHLGAHGIHAILSDLKQWFLQGVKSVGGVRPPSDEYVEKAAYAIMNSKDVTNKKELTGFTFHLGRMWAQGKKPKSKAKLKAERKKTRS